MFWRRSQASASDPDQLKKRLTRIFSKARSGDVFSLDDLADELKAERKESVAFALAQLASNQVVDQVVRVVSPRGGGISEYDSVDEIPRVIFDPYQLVEIDVDPTLIRVYFTKHRTAASDGSVPKDRSHALA